MIRPPAPRLAVKLGPRPGPQFGHTCPVLEPADQDLPDKCCITNCTSRSLEKASGSRSSISTSTARSAQLSSRTGSEICPFGLPPKEDRSVLAARGGIFVSDEAMSRFLHCWTQVSRTSPRERSRIMMRQLQARLKRSKATFPRPAYGAVWRRGACGHVEERLCPSSHRSDPHRLGRWALRCNGQIASNPLRSNLLYLLSPRTPGPWISSVSPTSSSTAEKDSSSAERMSCGSVRAPSTFCRCW